MNSAEAEKLDFMELISIYQKFKMKQATGGASKPSSLKAELMRTSLPKKTAKPRADKLLRRKLKRQRNGVSIRGHVKDSHMLWKN